MCVTFLYSFLDYWTKLSVAKLLVLSSLEEKDGHDDDDLESIWEEAVVA
jgi:hypothetical protein